MKIRHCSVGVLVLILLTGCDELPPEARKAVKYLASLLKDDVPSTAARPSPSPLMAEEDPIAKAAANARANSELLREMLQVIYMKEPKDRSEFGNWADTLNQGASLEGVFNGLTHSADYRKLEEANIGASPDALRAFGEELAYLEVELLTPTEFDSNSASPLPVLGNPDAVNPNEIEFKKAANKQPPAPGANPSTQPDIRVLADKYSKQFVGASIFTLKRVLSDEALKAISSKNEYREKLALWYSKWVVRIAQRNVDFGIALRNTSNEAFHYKWALQNTDDRIKWEVLNRLHRVLNEANRHN